MASVSPAECFWRRVDTSNPNGCWEFVGPRNARGYGMTGRKLGEQLAHRYAYRTCVGPLARGTVVRHRCDNPPCVNPSHLEAGTQADNIRDRYDRLVNGNPLRDEWEIDRLRREVLDDTGWHKSVTPEARQRILDRLAKTRAA